MIFDTDILIWAQRGLETAAARISGAEERHISAVSLMELFYGARDRKELKAIKEFLRDINFTTLPINEGVSHLAVRLVEDHGLSHGMEITDALIAATAVEHHQTLVTGNAKHYRHIKDLELVVFKP